MVGFCTLLCVKKCLYRGLSPLLCMVLKCAVILTLFWFLVWPTYWRWHSVHAIQCIRLLLLQVHFFTVWYFLPIDLLIILPDLLIWGQCVQCRKLGHFGTLLVLAWLLPSLTSDLHNMSPRFFGLLKPKIIFTPSSILVEELCSVIG